MLSLWLGSHQPSYNPVSWMLTNTASAGLQPNVGNLNTCTNMEQ